MGKYLKLFNLQNEYDSFILTDEFVLPNVSYITENEVVNFNPNIVDNDPYNGHEYVDLGLPSGTKWAKCNIGANSETETGLYFAWGETQGFTADQVISGVRGFYSGTDYKWGTDDADTFTKYNKSDGLSILLPEDDAATVNMGGEWHMPTEVQFNELTANTTNEWTTVNGVSGILFTSKINGNSVFFPAVGYCVDGSISNVGSYGYVWSCYLHPENVNGAWYLYFSSFVVGVYNYGRFCGRVVRGVVG